MPTCVKLPRPSCTTDGCDNKVTVIRNHYDDKGVKVQVSWRKFCSTCHNKRTAEKHGLKTIVDITARRNGFESAVAYLNSKHPDRKHRKNYCENEDGRLGFVCTTTIVWDGQLDTDHVDGNPSNRSENNFQTLCKCCHAYKTHKEKDYLSPGRKAYGITY